MRLATCSCRKLKLTAQGEPVRVSVCHCYECQLRSGSAFAFQARFPNDRVKVEGEYKTHIRVLEDGDQAFFNFCPHCGSTVFYTIESDPGVTAVAVGAFNDSKFPHPIYSVYETRMHSWFTLSKDMEHFD